MNLEEKLASFTGASSEYEQSKQELTERMIRLAIQSHQSLPKSEIRIFAKGSYANNTNVKLDSDVDIAVEFTGAVYSDYAAGIVRKPSEIYAGKWTPPNFRAEIVEALKMQFGSSVDVSGNTAITIHSSSTRVDADVVPCFSFRYFQTDSSFETGTKTFKQGGQDSFINFPEQQLSAGRSKNIETNYAYKKTVRILKRLENEMVSNSHHRPVPSYFIECLAFNCPNELFQKSTWKEVLSHVILHIFRNLSSGDEPLNSADRWLEANGLKFLFTSSQKWTRKDGQDFALAVWTYLKLENA